MRWVTQGRRPKRQAVLFLLALASPCLVLAGLGWQVNRQERQLAARRVIEAHEHKLAMFRADLLAELERIKHQTVSGRAPESVALAAAIRDGKLLLSVESDSGGREIRDSLETSDFGSHIRAGERDELAERRFDAAVARYGNALAAAHLPWQRAYAELLLARAERRAGRRPEALAHYRAVLQFPAGVRDEYGIPIALYAVAPLMDFAADRVAATRALRVLAGGTSQLATPALAMLRGLAGRLDAADLLPPLDRRLREREQAEALQSDLPRLLARLQGGEPVWIPYGDPLWLIGLAESPAGSMLVALSAGQLRDVPGRTRESPRIAHGREGEPLGDTFPGLRVVVPAQAAPEKGLAARYLSLALACVAALTLVAGVLLWRDLRRTERLAEMRSHFISSVSHELRTPLTSIRMFTESMRLDDEMDPGARAQYLDTVLHESERLSRLVDNVLHFARIEQGRAVYDLRPTRLPQIVQRALRSFEPLATQAGFALDVRVDPDLPNVLADADAIEQAVLNLLGNAMKYSGTSREIACRLERQDGSAAIRVIDSGIGVADGERDHIFERFYRGAAAENSQIPGAGLGLTLVEHIARAHKGRVSVESRLHAGSTFTLHIPFSEAT